MLMRRRFRVVTTVLAAALVAFATVPAASANAAVNARTVPATSANAAVNTRTVPVSGTVDGAGGTFVGTFTATQFVAENKQLMAVGTLAGTLTDPSGDRMVSPVPAAFPVTAAQATCTILDLLLGGIDLNLLGVVVHLNPIHLDVGAEPGGLIGTLLCLIAGLLGGGAPLTAAADPLNQLLPLL
jgi:hypothetical protein